MAGTIGSEELRRQTASWEGQGFLGNGQTFFEQLVKWFEPGVLNPLLRQVLDPPVDSGGARTKLGQFCDAIEEVLLSGRGIEPRRVLVDGVSIPIGLPDLSPRRVNFFVSIFWGAGHSDGWPVMFPHGRDTLIRRDLLEGDLRKPRIYSSYSDLVDGVKASLGIDSWAAEFLLWELWRSSH